MGIAVGDYDNDGFADLYVTNYGANALYRNDGKGSFVKARPGGADYIHALLTGYKEEPPAGVTVPDGMNYNEYYAGNMIAMAPPLYEDGIQFADGTKATVEQMSEDVTVFLAWAAEPELEKRKRMGIKVILFLLVLTGLLYVVKRRIWADVH